MGRSPKSVSPSLSCIDACSDSGALLGHLVCVRGVATNARQMESIPCLSVQAQRLLSPIHDCNLAFVDLHESSPKHRAAVIIAVVISASRHFQRSAGLCRWLSANRSIPQGTDQPNRVGVWGRHGSGLRLPKNASSIS